MTYINALQLKDELGNPYGVKHVNNRPRVSSQSYLYDIAEGNVPGHVGSKVFGLNDNVGLTEETVSNMGGLYVYLTAAEQLKVVSTSANDAAAGTGARTVTITGLDASYVLLTETVTLNGTTAVTTVGSFLRVFTAKVITAGTTGSNEGTVTVNNNAITNVLGQISIGNNRSLQAVFTVPAGKTLYLTSWDMGAINGKDTRFYLYARKLGEVFQLRDIEVGKDVPVNINYDMPFSFPEKTDIELRASCEVAGGIISADFEGWYE